jgi:hypothetical protein
MKKSFTKVIAAVLSVLMLLSCTSVMSFAADDQQMENISDSFGDWFSALSNYKVSDFYEFISAILSVFGFKGSFEGVHSLPELMNEWFEMLGPIGDFYENFINSIGTSDLLDLIMGLLA